MTNPKYRRVLIKISGEALAGIQGTGLDFDILNHLSSIIKRCVDEGVQVSIVVGAGNIWRGVKNGSGKIDRTPVSYTHLLSSGDYFHV